MKEWLGSILRKMTVTLIGFAALAYAIRRAWEYLEPAVPLFIAVLLLLAILLFVLHRPRGW